MEIKILYALVANCEASDHKIVASYSPSLNKDLAEQYQKIVVDTIKDLTTLDEEKISISRNKYTVHLLIGELHYACLTSSEGSPVDATVVASCAQEFLSQVRTVYRELPILADLSRELQNFSSINLSAPLSKIMGGLNQDISLAVPAMKEELVEVRRVLLDSVQKLIDRGEKLEELIRKTQSLELTVHKDFQLIPKCLKKKKTIWLSLFLMIVIFLSSFALGTVIYIQGIL